MAAVVEGTLGTGTGPGDSPPLATPSATPIDISPASDSGTAGQLRLQTSWRAEAPRVAPKAIDVTDLQALLPFFQAHNEKLYFSGVVFKRRDLDSHGRKIALKDREDVWTSWWVELRGSVMQFWGAADEDLQKATAGPPSADLVAAIKEKQPVPNYINITDGCTTVVPDHGERHSQAISSPMSTITENSDAQTLTPASSTARSPTDVPPDARFAHRFHMTSAGCNLYTLGCPTVHMRDGWLFAIRLAQFEFARLCEAFTFRLLQRPAVSKSAWSDLGVDRTTMAPTNRAKPGEILQQGWLLARVTYETEWSRFWCVVTAGDDKLEATPRSTVDRRSADMASLAPSAVSGKSGDGKDTSSIFGRFLSAPKSPRPGHSDTFHVARIALYSDKKDLKKNRDPIIVIQGCYSAFALYPGRAELVMGPGVVKVEADNIRVRWDLLHPPASPGRRERRPFSTSPSAPFVLFMLPTVQDLARLVLSICGSASAPGHALLHANADMEDCAVDSEGSQLWLSVAELVAFLPFLRSLPTMAPKAELLALIAEKRRIIGQSNDSEQDWIQKVQKRWSEWLSSGLNADVGLRIPSFGKASDQMKRVKSGTSRSPRKPSSKVDEAVRRAYEIAMLMEAAANKNLSPKSPGAFSFSAGPDVLSTMNTPLAERAPTASYASATPLRLATPSAVAPAVQASLAPQPATSPQRLGTEAAEGGAEESEEDLPLALAVHKQTIVEEEVSEFVAPIKIAAGETQQSADQPEIPTEAAPSIVEDEQVAGEDSSSDGDEDPEDARSPVTIEQLIQQEYQAADDQTDSVPTEVAPIAVPMLTVTQQSSMVLVAVPSPTVQEDGQQVWDWEYQLVERDELNASIVEVSLAAAQEAVLASQPQPPVDKLIKLTVVTRNDAKPDAPDSAPSEADTVVPSGTIESTTEGRTDAPAGVPAVSEDLGGQGDDQGEDAADFHTPTNEEVAEEVANVVQVSKQADPVEQVAGVAMNPVTGNETDGEEDEKPLVHQTTSMSLNMIGPQDSASVVGQNVMAQATYAAHAQYPQAYMLAGPGTPPMDPRRAGVYRQPQLPGTFMPGSRPTSIHQAAYGQMIPGMSIGGSAVPTPMSGPQSIVGGQSALGYGSPLPNPYAMGSVPAMATDPYDFDDSASVRARNSLAMAWLEREREKERQRQHERVLEHTPSQVNLVPQAQLQAAMQYSQPIQTALQPMMQMPAMQMAPTMQGYPAMQSMPMLPQSMPPLIPGSVVFIPGYGYVQQPPQMAPQLVQPAMWAQPAMYPVPVPVGRVSRGTSEVGTVRSFTSAAPRSTVSRFKAQQQPTVDDSDEDLPLSTLGRAAPKRQGEPSAQAPRQPPPRPQPLQMPAQQPSPPIQPPPIQPPQQTSSSKQKGKARPSQ